MYFISEIEKKHDFANLHNFQKRQLKWLRHIQILIISEVVNSDEWPSGKVAWKQSDDVIL